MTVDPLPKSQSYDAFSLIPFENSPNPVKLIFSSISTSTEPFVFAEGFDNISEKTSWQGSKQLITASHPPAWAALLLKNLKVKQPVSLLAVIKPGPELELVPEYILIKGAEVFTPS